MLQKKDQENQEIKEQQEHNDLVQFFDLLLKIDQRENPELYKINNNDKKDDWYSNFINTSREVCLR